jgi:hypothetical protein
MDYSFTSAAVSDRAPTREHENDGALHLTIDTSVVTHPKHHGISIPRSTSTSNGEHELVGAIQNETSINKTLSHSLQRPDTHARIRAMSESERAFFDSGTGVRIPQKHATSLHTQLTPPFSNSPGFFDTHDPYSTSAHIFPADSPPSIGFPDTPRSNPSSVSPTRRNSKGLILSLPSSSHIPKSTPFLSPSDGITRSLSYSFGAHSQQQAFVDASSYEGIPESPAKNVTILCS